MPKIGAQKTDWPPNSPYMVHEADKRATPSFKILITGLKAFRLVEIFASFSLLPLHILYRFDRLVSCIMSTEISLPVEKYTIGWVCVKKLEVHAAKALLDETYSKPSPPGDDSPYFGGKMGGHNIVIGKAVKPGKSAAAITAADMIRSFRNIRFVLMVGIAGGAATAIPPAGVSASPKYIFLGDVVVSTPEGPYGEFILKP